MKGNEEICNLLVRSDNHVLLRKKKWSSMVVLLTRVLCSFFTH